MYNYIQLYIVVYICILLDTTVYSWKQLMYLMSNLVDIGHDYDE